MFDGKIICGSLSINIALRQVHNQQQEVYLSKLGFNLFLYLVQNANKLCTYEQLLTDVWHYPKSSKQDAKIVRLALSRLREKLGNCPQNSFTFVTVREVGIYFKTSEPIETN